MSEVDICDSLNHSVVIISACRLAALKDIDYTDITCQSLHFPKPTHLPTNNPSKPRLERQPRPLDRRRSHHRRRQRQPPIHASHPPRHLDQNRRLPRFSHRPQRITRSHLSPRPWNI